MLFGIQKLATLIAIEPVIHCDCAECIDDRNEGSCENKCSSVLDMVIGKSTYCPEAHPPELPALFQMPLPEFSATKSSSTASVYSSGLPDDSCKKDESCPVTILITGQNRTFAQSKNLAHHE